ELLGEHPGRLIDLSAVPDEVRELAAWGGLGRLYSLTRGPEQQQGRGIGENQRITELDRAERAWSVPVHAHHADPYRPHPQREREHRRCPDPACSPGEGGPEASGLHFAQVRGQDRTAGRRCIVAWALAKGELQLGEPFAHLIGHIQKVTRPCTPPGG